MTNKLGSANPNRIKGLKSDSKVKNIYKYYKVPGLYETSGQPTRNQLKLLVEKDYEVVYKDSLGNEKPDIGYDYLNKNF